MTAVCKRVRASRACNENFGNCMCTRAHDVSSLVKCRAGPFETLMLKTLSAISFGERRPSLRACMLKGPVPNEPTGIAERASAVYA